MIGTKKENESEKERERRGTKESKRQIHGKKRKKKIMPVTDEQSERKKERGKGKSD